MYALAMGERWTYHILQHLQQCLPTHDKKTCYPNGGQNISFSPQQQSIEHGLINTAAGM